MASNACAASWTRTTSQKWIQNSTRKSDCPFIHSHSPFTSPSRYIHLPPSWTPVSSKQSTSYRTPFQPSASQTPSTCRKLPSLAPSLPGKVPCWKILLVVISCLEVWDCLVVYQFGFVSFDWGGWRIWILPCLFLFDLTLCYVMLSLLNQLF